MSIVPDMYYVLQDSVPTISIVPNMYARTAGFCSYHKYST